MQEYFDVVTNILTRGAPKQNRTGVGTTSLFAEHYQVNLESGFPLLTTKKMPWKSILIENLWFLGGSSSPEFLHKHGVKFWDPWIEEDGNLPKAYGEFWRAYPWMHFKCWQQDSTPPVAFDQFEAIVEGLKEDPNNRRLVLTNWYPPSAWTAKLPPCHLMAIFNVQYTKAHEQPEVPHLNLHLTQRSCDVPVGVPFNLAGYAFILSLVGHLTGIKPKIFAHTLVDAHIYDNQLNGVIEQLSRDPLALPELVISPDIKTLADVDAIIRDATTEQILEAFKLKNYKPHGRIEFPVTV